MTAATLAGKRVMGARVHLPAWGVAWAEVELDEEATLSGPVELAIADLKLSATVMSGGPGPVGRSSYRIAAGRGGWGRMAPAKSYANDAGVKASTVLVDAASAAGETLDHGTLPSTRLGPVWARDEGPASRTLERVAPAGWYVAEDGWTRIGRRPPVPFTGQAMVGPVDRARATVTIAAEAIAALLPGAVVAGLEAVDVLHELSAGALRTTIWGSGTSPTTRRLSAWRRIFDALDPDRRFRGLYEYRIVFQIGERLNLQIVRVSTGMPDLQLVPVRAGVAGVKARYALGSRVLVGFIDADGARPVVVGFEEPGFLGFQPSEIQLGEDEAVLLGSTSAPGRFVRYGDPILFATPGPGVIAAPAAPANLSTVRSG